MRCGSSHQKPNRKFCVSSFYRPFPLLLARRILKRTHHLDTHNMIQGFLRISRNIVDWDWYTDANTFRVFMHLLLTANYKDCNYKGVEVKRGQVATSRMEIAKALRMSEQNVRTSLSHLKSTSEITSKSTNKLTIITLCKYDSWQDLVSESNQQTNRESTDNLTVNQPTIEEESNKYNNNNKEKENTNVFPKKKNSLDLSIVSQEMREAVDVWLAYKKEKGQTYKPTGFKTFYNNLIKLSDNNPILAMRIVEKSMQNNYAGIFALRDWEKETVLRDSLTKQQEMPTGDDMVINGQIYR